MELLGYHCIHDTKASLKVPDMVYLCTISKLSQWRYRRSEPTPPLLEIIKSEDFRKAMSQVGGYDTSQTGATTFNQ